MQKCKKNFYVIFIKILTKLFRNSYYTIKYKFYLKNFYAILKSQKIVL